MEALAELHHSAHQSLPPTLHNKSTGVPQTLLGLLDRLDTQEVPNFPALKSKATVLSGFLQKSPDAITLDDVEYAKPNIRPYLVGRKLAENSIRAYVSEIGKLLKHASELGWVSGANVPTVWRPILDESTQSKCASLCRAMMRLHSTPKQVTVEAIDAWVAEQTQHGKAWRTARGKATSFMKVMSACGVLHDLPPVLKEDFGVRFDDFPVELRKEIDEVIRWKTASFSPSRSKRGKIRGESANNLQRSFRELYGFAIRIAGIQGIASVLDLVTPDIVNRYVEWALNERKVKGVSIHSRLVVILAVLKQHPRYRDYDPTWLRELTDAIPTESLSEMLEKQAAKQVPYASIETIPLEIHAERRTAARHSEKELALTVRNELLMLWLTILPWRQRNIRECRVGGQRPNLFKAKLDPVLPIARPAWVQEALRTNPDCEFWQFRFRPAETKVGNGVHALLPRPLIPLLEEYLTSHRPTLLQGRNSEHLFLGQTGSTISRPRMTEIIGELTLRHIGKRITPHTFRHICAYAWLHDHPEDFLTLSKILWHTNINTTLRCYGARFNESNGACGMEKWIEARKK